MLIPGNDLHKLRERRRMWLSIGIVLILLGLLALVAPLVLAQALTLLVGLVLIASGGAQLLLAWDQGSWGRRLLSVLVGLGALAVGLLVTFSSPAAMRVITMAIGAYLVAAGLLRVLSPIRMRVFGREWLQVSGIVTALLGLAVLFQWPLAGPTFLAVAIGLSLLLQGVSTLALVVYARRQPVNPVDAA